jgi:hypothetical protein
MGLVAACTAITLHLASMHLTSGDYNEVNPGIGITCNQYHAGAYYNSLRRVSTYVGRSWEWCRGPVCGGVALMAVSGYKTPVIAPLPMLSIGRDWRLVMIAAPRVVKYSAAFVGFGIQKRIGR